MVEDVSHQYGENLFGICCLLPEDSSYFNVSDAVTSWDDELSDYAFNNQLTQAVPWALATSLR